MDLWLDTETRSPIALRNGTARYATMSEVMIVTWAVDDGPVRCWDVTSLKPFPDELYDALWQCDKIIAWNAWFDRTVLGQMHWWPKDLAPITKWRCAMVQMLSHGLPGSLDLACKIFNLAQEQSKLDGKKYINMFCKPQGKHKTWKDRTTNPSEWAEFLVYAQQDIVSMRAASKAAPKWNSTPFERDLWHWDQGVNSTGFATDNELAAGALNAINSAQAALRKRTQELTGDAIESTTQRDKLLEYLLLEYNVALPNMRAATLEKTLEDPELPEGLKELIRIRLQASKSSTSKYKRVLETEVGGRLYGTMQFAGAGRTQRWAGRLFQPQNLTRLDTDAVAAWHGLDVKDVKKKHIQHYLDEGVAAIKGGYADIMFDNVMALAANCARGVIVAGPGKKLVISDLANIEGRKLAWLAGEDWKLKAFRDYDAGIGFDLYVLAYARAFNVDPSTVTPDQRQIGKVMELALGYQGGVGAFITMVPTYGIDLDELARKAWPTIPKDVLSEAEAAWARATAKKRTLGLKREVWVVCTALVRLWRDAHPETTSLWGECETNARHAIMNPGKVFTNRNGLLSFDRKGNWLRIKLPSGRYLSYPDPKLDGNAIHYAAVSVYTKSWQRVYTYGGKIVENADQASSRDKMAYGMMKAEQAGYRHVLSIHDEGVTEVPREERYNDKDLSRIYAANDDWNIGLPLAAKGFTTDRYRKD